MSEFWKLYPDIDCTVLWTVRNPPFVGLTCSIPLVLLFFHTGTAGVSLAGRQRSQYEE
jgi:hypothetical protein